MIYIYYIINNILLGILYIIIIILFYILLYFDIILSKYYYYIWYYIINLIGAQHAHTQRNIFEILLNQTEMRLSLPFSDWFGSKRKSIWFKINRKIVKTIWFRFDLIRFRKYFSVCTYCQTKVIDWLEKHYTHYGVSPQTPQHQNSPMFRAFQEETKLGSHDDERRQSLGQLYAWWLLF